MDPWPSHRLESQLYALGAGAEQPQAQPRQRNDTVRHRRPGAVLDREETLEELRIAGEGGEGAPAEAGMA